MHRTRIWALLDIATLIDFLGVLTAVGLVSALFSDGGVGDAVAWVALGIPVAVGAWYGWRRPARRS